MGKPQGFGPISADRRAGDEESRVRPSAADRRRKDRPAVGRNAEQTVGRQEPPASVGVPREPLSQSGPDPGELGRPPRQRHDGEAELPMERVEVDHIEPPEDRTIHQQGANALERTGGSHQGDDPRGRILSVDRDRACADRLDVVGRGKDHRCDRSACVAPLERPVVDPHDPGVCLTERAP